MDRSIGAARPQRDATARAEAAGGLTPRTTLPSMVLHPLAAQFASVADVYERGRPEYPPAVVGAFTAELGVAPGAPVLDLAAGTGKLTRALLAAGFDVVAVEPQAPLRARIATVVGRRRVREGVAEAIPLSDASVDAVTVADGFHWFNHAEALAEIRRVLTPGGGLAVLSTVPDWSAASWGHELGTMIQRLRPEHPFFDGPSWQEAARTVEGGRRLARSASPPISPPIRRKSSLTSRR